MVFNRDGGDRRQSTVRPGFPDDRQADGHAGRSVHVLASPQKPLRGQTGVSRALRAVRKLGLPGRVPRLLGTRSLTGGKARSRKAAAVAADVSSGRRNRTP